MKKLLGSLVVLLSPLAFAQGAVTVWTHFTETQELEWLLDQAAAFEEATGTRVDIVEVPFDDIRQKLVLSASGEDAPDLVVSVPQDWLGEVVSSGALEPLDAFADETYRSDVQTVALDAFTYEGRLFALPMFAESLALVYNRALVPDAPATWEEFLATAKLHTTDDSFGFLYQLDIPYYGFGFWKAYGGYLFGEDEDGTTDASDMGLGGEAGVAAASLIKDLRFTHGLVPEGVDYGVANSAFVDGISAMILNGPWAIGDYKDAGIDFGIAPVPTPPGASEPWGPLVGVQGVVLNGYSTNQDEAMNFARWLVAPEQQVSFNQAGGRIPVSLPAIEELSDDPVVEGFSRTIALGVPMPNVPQMSQVWGAWGNALQLVVQSPDSDVSAIIEAMERELENVR